MEKNVGALCPNCGHPSLNIYYEDGARSASGAKCDSCAFIGVFMNNELLPLEFD